MAIDTVDIIKIIAGSGFISAFSTWGLNHMFVYKTSINRDARYIALRISVILETYSIECAVSISENDEFQRSNGEAGCQNGMFLPTVSFDVNADWKVLDANIANKIISFPVDISCVNHQLSSILQFEEDIDGSRVANRAGIYGIKAYDLAQELRNRYNIPNLSLPNLSSDLRKLLKSRADINNYYN